MSIRLGVSAARTDGGHRPAVAGSTAEPVSAARTDGAHRPAVPGSTAEPVSAARTDGAHRPAVSDSTAEPVPDGTRPCTFDTGGPIATPRYARSGLVAGRALAGPVVVEDAWSTVVVPPGATLTADEAGHLRIATGVST